ncbi:MAG: nucleotidyltransferase domain-containing protein [Nanoarchaeota archaeon]|nr:nucleotidyltransferase domain-containing protein [Nanoarchaeota archaeon]
MESKEEKIISLFFNEPTKHWHFEAILKTAKISRPQAASWLKKFLNAGLVKKVKDKGKMPYYLGDYENPEYQTRKKIYAMEQMAKAGFLQHLASLPKVKTAIIFGSFCRWDWYKESDIDLFIYGDPEGLKTGEYELKLHRDIQLFICENKEELLKFRPGLIKNIIKGNMIKGNIDFVKVNINV